MTAPLPQPRRRTRRMPALEGGGLGGSSSGFLPFVVAVMCFLATLALAVALAVSGAASRWDRELAGGATVQIPVPPVQIGSAPRAPAAGQASPATAPTANTPEAAAAIMDRRVDAALIVLRDTAGVLRAEPVDRMEAARLLSPWLGDAALSPDLPVPRLIDVTFRGDQLDQGTLAKRLAAAVPGATFDDHRQWVDSLRRLGSAVVGGALAVLALMGAVAAISVVFAARAALAIQVRVIEVLHLIGAPDGFIASGFARHVLWRAAIGAAIGQVLAAGCVLALGHVAESASTDLMAMPGLRPLDWVLIALLTPVAAFVASFTARLTVLANLRRLA